MNAPTLPDAAGQQQPPAPIGHNNPPAFDAAEVAKLNETATAFIQATEVWKRQDVESETLAGQLADQITGLRANRKAVDEARKAAKKPHDDAGKAVQAAFTPIIERYDMALLQLQVKQTDWLKKVQAQEEERKRREREEAEAKAAEARRMELDAAQSGTIDDQLAAEKARKEAEAAQKAALKPAHATVKSASGAGRTASLRKRKVVTITDVRRLFMHFQNDPEVHEVLGRLATRQANAAGFEGTIPGTTIDIVETAV